MDKQFIIHTSEKAIVNTLSKEDKNGASRLIACGSRNISDTETRYAPYELECLAVRDHYDDGDTTFANHRLHIPIILLLNISKQ